MNVYRHRATKISTAKIYACNPIADFVAAGVSMASRSETADWHIYDTTGRRKYVSAAEFNRFIDVAHRLPPHLEALCCVLAYTGCRISEALALGRYQLDEQQGLLTFRTLKRRKAAFRTVPIPNELASSLAKLPLHQDERFWMMHRVTAWRHIKGVMQEIEVKGPMACCKGLRHGFGIRAASQKLPSSLIQRWMGHASINTTSIYMDAIGAEEREFAARMW